MKKHLLSVALMTVCLFGSSSAWAVDYKTNKSFDFEVESQTDFTAVSSTFAIEDDATTSSKVLSFTKSNGTKSISLGQYDFSSISAGATSVTVSLDFNPGTCQGQTEISLADATMHTVENGDFTGGSRWGYGQKGAIFKFGINGSSKAQKFRINAVNDEGVALDTWYHMDVTVDVVNKKVSYKMTSLDGSTTISEASDLDFLTYTDKNEETFIADACTQIDIYGGNNNTTKIDNLTITATKIKKAIGTAGYASFSAPVNVAVPEGVKVYKAVVNAANTSVNLTEVEASVIPANQGVVLGGAAGDVDLAYTSADADASLFEGNELVATSATSTVPSDGTYYALVANTNTFGVLQAGLKDTAGDKAYLKAKAAAAKSLTISMGDVTAINEINAVETEADGEWYTLQGVKVAQPTKGVFIKNGKKVIVK